MQSAFCTNCGQPLVAGAAFCPACGTRVEAPPAATPGSVQPGTNYSPGSTPQAYAAPVMSPPPGTPAAAPKNRTATIVGWVGGCLVAFLAAVALLIGSLIYGLLTHRLAFFIIGAVGLALIILVVVAIEHVIRRLYRRARGGIEALEHPGYAGPRYRESAYRRPQQQRGFRPIRFLFTLVFIGAAIYGGLYLYYTQEFVGDWSGILSVGGAQQGLLANLQISLSFHRPASLSFSDPGSLDVTVVTFKQSTAQACNKDGSQSSYQLSGTASRLDAATVGMTLSNTQGSLQLQGTYQNDKFTLTGTSQGKPATLTLQKGGEQDYAAACKQLALAGSQRPAA